MDMGITAVFQIANTLILIGFIVLFFYLIFSIIRAIKKISSIENKVNNIEQTIKNLEDRINK